MSFTLVLLNIVYTSAHLPWIIYPQFCFLFYVGVQGEEGGQEEAQETSTRIMSMAPLNIQMVAMDI